MSNTQTKLQELNNISGVEDLLNQNAANVSGGSSGFMGGMQSDKYIRKLNEQHFRRRSHEQHFRALSYALRRRGLSLPSSLTLLSRFPHLLPR
jgi:hypothetical protein